jgi:acyl-CoA reductase-like NAD-dependent aldehyde dehydrogenase/nicotinamidase-related amidase
MKIKGSDTAFLFVDLQNDFLQRPGVLPEASALIEAVSDLLKGARSIGAPVIHIHTAVSADGSDAMPHWKGDRPLVCVRGTHGAATPEELTPLESEEIVYKSFYSGFETGELAGLLEGMAVGDIVIAGLYTHACVRSTALDAYAKGYTVSVALDAVASPESLHAEITRDFLEKRGIPFLRTSAILGRAMKPAEEDGAEANSAKSMHDAIRRSQAEPVESKLSFGTLSSLESKEIDAEISSMRGPMEEWQERALEDRAVRIERWKDALQARRTDWIHMIVNEVDKPLRDAEDEFERALSSMVTAIEVARLPNEAGNGFYTTYRPVGTVAIITPWNNPMAIPVGKIAPALLYGNAVVWKPSPYAERLADSLEISLLDSGIPVGLLKIVKGDAEAVRDIVRHPSVSAVSLTGSHDTGRIVGALCSAYAKPLQAELGGNNAVIVRPDAVLADVVPGLVRSAFGFSGQRCTATRRFIVDRSIADSFIRSFKEETERLVVGMPYDNKSDLGPLISERHAKAIEAKVRKAIREGAVSVFSGTVPDTPNNGRWYPPTVLMTEENLSDIVQQETFGPVAVIQLSSNMDHALRLADGVKQGLVAGMVGGTSEEQRLFTNLVRAGILNIGSPFLSLDMHAPFSGWKESSIGTPEHGRWDREFFSRVQAVYHRPD